MDTLLPGTRIELNGPMMPVKSGAGGACKLRPTAARTELPLRVYSSLTKSRLPSPLKSPVTFSEVTKPTGDQIQIPVAVEITNQQRRRDPRNVGNIGASAKSSVSI